MIQKVEGIVIRTTDYGEANKILTLFSREMGKIGVVARGAKKTKSRLSAVSQLFTHGTFVFFQGSGMGNLSQGDVITSFRGIRQDIEKTAWAAYLAELVDKFAEDKERNPFLFDQFKMALTLINDGKDAEVIARIFEFKILSLAGVVPEVRWCVSCRREQAPFVAFSLTEGGLLCEACLSKDREAIILSAASIRLLRLFSRMDLRQLGNVDLREQTREQLDRVMKGFMDRYLDTSFRSRQFLEQLRRGDWLVMRRESEDPDGGKPSP